jgi:hypothetical protein
MIEVLINPIQSKEEYLGEEWLMSGNLLSKYEFDKAFKLAKQSEFISLSRFWEKVPFATSRGIASNSKQEVSISNLIHEQLNIVCLAYLKSGDPLLETLLAEFEFKVNNLASHPFMFPACANYPSNEKIKSVRYILCGEYKIVFQANKYFVHIAFITHSSRCKKLVKDKFSHW